MIWVRYLKRSIINSADTENIHCEPTFIELHATQSSSTNQPNHRDPSKDVFEHLVPYKTFMWSSVLSMGASQKQLALIGLRTEKSYTFCETIHSFDKYALSTFYVPGMVLGPSQGLGRSPCPQALGSIVYLTRLPIYAASGNFLGL